jgi:mRNA interferase MazF
MTDQPQYIPKQGDIVLINLNPTLGVEKKGIRPALVVSNNLLQEKSKFLWIVPITNGDWDFPLHVEFLEESETDGSAHTEQLRSIDYTERVIKKLGEAPQDTLKTVLAYSRSILS